ncbi:HEAT repeat domain-containing protein [Thermomonospora umbrina]|uniref:HEAT repeat protein n=1 Tax=Thermomonospora umbrina TaxID=111806 RepID=A0A3D9SI11_9ACTN|nr:HEAT repeat domain-containing protein [Thermomonospora umbrina]REE95327.1 HEAT repeat protein [Thermomonospora umbrina]
MSARIVELLELADEAPEVEDLEPYLDDPDPAVRRAALQVLSEAADDWSAASPRVAGALLDDDAAVRGMGADLLAELREVLVCGPAFGAALREALASADPTTRVAALGSLWRHRLCLAADALAALADPDSGVRREAVRALVSLDDLDGLARAAADADPLVRQAAAAGLGEVGDPRGLDTLGALAADVNPFVRAVAFAAMASTGCHGPGLALVLAALGDASWEVRQGAAVALAAADPDRAVGPLAVAAGDDNIDVRKAAVRSLGRWPDRPDVRSALSGALDDADADVRAWARLGLDPR